jgi:nicotinamide-nucleotide amidase
VKAEILTIGDEVLRGEIVDSNKALLASRLLQLDIECHHQVSVRDDPADMRDAFHRAVSRSDLLLVSGGLGPTRDDLTTEVLAEAFDRGLEFDEKSFEAMRAFFDRVGREMNETNRKQAFFPTGAEILVNPVGTAPGFILEERGTLVVCMPGVPRELSLMMDEQVLPRVQARLQGSEAASRVRARLLRTFGMGESTLEGELSDLAKDGEAELAFRTSFPDNFLRVVARGASVAEADARIDSVVEKIRERIGDLVYGEGEEPLEAVVGGLLAGAGRTIAVAESCTGGLIAGKLTDLPGSSAYFLGGVVAYANSAKQGMLGVPEEMLVQNGAVSDPVVRAMASGARERFGADIGLATTGISGPGGGSEEKPVGMVHIGIAWGENIARPEGSDRSSQPASEVAILSTGAGEGSALESTAAGCFVFPLDRGRHRTLTAQVALDWARRLMIGAELVGPSLMRRGGGSAPGSSQIPDSTKTFTPRIGSVDSDPAQEPSGGN